MDANERGYRSLNAWRKADELVLMVYRLTKKFPRDELFGLISQMRRCAISVVANIVEGYGRRTAKDKVQFYYIARGSLNELEYYLDLSLKLGYVAAAEHEACSRLRDTVGRLLSGLIKFVER